MKLLDELKRRAPSAIIPLLCAGTIAYFGYHAVEGGRGIYAYARLQQEINLVNQALVETGKERRQMELRVALLRSDKLDLDILDEQARKVLGLIRGDELVIYSDR